MRSSDDLAATLRRIDGRGYKAYKDLRGSYALAPELGLGADAELHIDHVQGDPFAAPSKLRLRIGRAHAGIPDELFSTPVRRVALRDALAREVRRALRAEHGIGRGSAGSGKSGLVEIDAGGQEVLERSAFALGDHGDDWIEARIEVGLPADGRRVRGREAERLLLDALPAAAAHALVWNASDELGDRVRRLVQCVEHQEAIRSQLASRGLVAFVANGALLARESGASDGPMRAEDCVPFCSPPSLEVEIEGVRGMGVPCGVTLIVGGGYHGKSTLLRALERGVHPHVPGDGREGVVALPSLVKVRAEDGRAVVGVDIHAFVRELPGATRRTTRCFSSEDASGSTSQAANIVEAIEAGAAGILLDEDTSATNFMVRDARMQALVARDAEPITPFVERVRELWEEHGVSTVLVMGGSGDYFDVADTVIAMRDFEPSDATKEAQRIAREQPSTRRRDATLPFEKPAPRAPLARSFDASRGRREVKIAARDTDELEYGRLRVELRGLEQLLDPSQTRAIGYAIHWISEQLRRGREPLPERTIQEPTLPELLDAFERLVAEQGLDPLAPFHRAGEHPGNLARPRRFELVGVINRMRSLRVVGAAED